MTEPLTLLKKSIQLLPLLTLLLLQSCTPTSLDLEKTTISGSDTDAELVREMVNEYNNIYDNQEIIEVLASGTNKGIESFVNGNIVVVNASRPMSDDERSTAIANDINPIEVILAYDALAIITNPMLGVDSLTLNQVAGIFSGQINNWKEVGGPDLAIQRYGRDYNSGTRLFMAEQVIHGSFAADVQPCDDTEGIVQKVKEDLTGIGYVGVGHIMEPNGKPRGDIWAMYLYNEDLPAISPYERRKVLQGEYPICRPLYQYFNGMPSGHLMDFLQFELSKAGQQIVELHGFFPVNENQKALNLKKGIFVHSNTESLINRYESTNR